MDNIKTESTVIHITLSVLVGLIVMYLAVDFTEEEGLNRQMDSFFWLAFIFTFFSLRYRKTITAWMRKKFQ